MQIPTFSITSEKQNNNNNNQNDIEIVKLFCIGYSKLNELQEKKVDINDSEYLKCLNHMKAHQLPNHINLPSQYYSFIKRVNNKHIILVKENQIKSISFEMHKIQTNSILSISNPKNSMGNSIAIFNGVGVGGGNDNLVACLNSGFDGGDRNTNIINIDIDVCRRHRRRCC
ncbi:hypothetical protein RB653_010295 [Dictyostelium firmibasis]|uniref:Uncharacterized protein n=1 Tax=Dictyostelium firmibasis TaxID=79012 RepID=A0AAN7TZ33_9MYCE